MTAPLTQGDVAVMVANARGLASLGMAGGYDEVLYELADAVDGLFEQFETLRKVAEGLFQMIDRETWRASGGDDQQGHYEGDYWAEQIEEYLGSLRASNPATKPDDCR